MLLRSKSPLLDWSGQAKISFDHPACCFGKPVLLINETRVGPIQSDWANYEILDATAAQLEALDRGDYHFQRKVKRAWSFYGKHTRKRVLGSMNYG